MAKQDISVNDLVSKVQSGELTLPEMQRRYVWKSTRVRDLLDSLYRKFPSGAILVWETDSVNSDRTLQIADVKQSPLSGKLLLLDGQQRLTSLTSIISGQPVKVRNKKKEIDILFNLEHPDTLLEQLYSEDEEDDDDDNDDDDDDDDLLEEIRKKTFVVAFKRLKSDPYWISVTDIFKKKDSELLRPLKVNSDDPRWEKYTERIQAVRAIRNYIYSMEILDKSLSYEEVTEIFVRVNSLGAKLRGSDLALAQITSRWKGFMTEMESYVAQHKYNQDYFNETGILVKALVSLATGQSKFKSVNRIPITDLQKSWKDTKTGVDFAVNFLKQNIQVENLSILSSPFLIIPIAYYAVKKNQQLTAQDVKKLQYWFYIANMKGRYSHGSTEGFLDADLLALKRTNGLDEMIAQLKLQFRDFKVTVEEISGKTRRSPYFSTLFLILKQRGVKDWASGIAIGEKLQGRSHALQFHHIIPKARLRDAGIESRRINEIANLAFISARTNQKINAKTPEKYIPEIIKKLGVTAITDQLVSDDPELWNVSNYDEFLNYRREQIVNTINEFIETHST